MNNIKNEIEKMNIIHFSTLDFGGAGFAAYKFHKNLQKYGMNSILFVQEKTREDESIIEIKQSKFKFYLNKVFKAFENILGKFHKKYLFYDRTRYSLKDAHLVIKHLNFIPDIIIMESITTFVDLEVIYELQKKYNTKVYWYIFDMAPMTGGCHFSWECEGYIDGCQECPAVESIYKDLPSKNLINKSKYLKKINYELLMTVRWIEDRVRISSIYRNTPSHFLTVGFNETIFKPSDKINIRKKKGIPLHKKVLFFGALNTTEIRKGYKYLIDALRFYQSEYSHNKVVIVTAGYKSVALETEGINIEHYHLGLLNGDYELAEAYAFSDVFISPVIEDIGPAMVVESMLCGTPVVAFGAGVALDLVKTGETGYLAKFKDHKDLAKGINTVLNLSALEYTKLSHNCRKIALIDHTEKCQIKQFNTIVKN